MALVVIPARMGATRLPGKPLLAETGTPLVVHCLRRAREARRASRVVVATDDARIRDAVRADGGEAVLTSPACRTGTDRVAEAAAALPGEDLVVNLQGDEPEFDPAYLDALADAMEADPAAPMGTLAAPLDPPGDLERPSAVKVVTDRAGNALYFSRAAVPYPREPGGAAPLRHLGVYAFRRAALASFASLPQGDLERAEALEQLRALENGWRIKVVRVPRAVPGVDTREDYDAFVGRWRAAAGKGRA